MKKAIVVTCGKSKIGDLIKGAEVFSGGEKVDCAVVVAEAGFNDAISKLKEHFGTENVRPYSCKNGSAAGKRKKENYFFV
ncbi:MAG: hypothetical protein WC349_03700 [Patescibacteria group bacterium]|jgi:hypothetical protein